ncbi:hypothetical protein TNCV_57441 [Trichonephila clavipes]|nr:hypothetical protein TNCV_57441 [Trichonephila clavipes]
MWKAQLHRQNALIATLQIQLPPDLPSDPAHFGILQVKSLSFEQKCCTQDQHKWSFRNCICRQWCKSFKMSSHAGETLYTILLQQGALLLRRQQYLYPLLMESLLRKKFYSTSVNVRPVAINNCQLREDEGQELIGSQRTELDSFLKNHHSIFEVGGEVTPFIEHSINTENNPPISVPPYRMNPARKELLKKELDSLLQQVIIVECESPYASPVVLIPKPNSSMRLCIDKRKLNAQTATDSYPLPRMDDLLNEAKPTPYISTIDLRSGYHQVEMVAEDKDKTAFTCPFGIYKFTRMPFRL